MLVIDAFVCAVTGFINLARIPFSHLWTYNVINSLFKFS